MTVPATSSKFKNFVVRNVIFLYVFVAVFANILANEKPLLISVRGELYFPALSNNPYIGLPDSSGRIKQQRTNAIDWKNFNADFLLFPPVCWSPVKSDLVNSYASPFDEQYFIKNGETERLPFRFRHFLGTGKTGNDVFAGLIYGTRTSLSIGFFSVLIAVLLGISLGGIAGYFGDHTLRINRNSFILMLLMLFPAWFYSFHLRREILFTSFTSSVFGGIIQLLICLFIFTSIFSWPYFLKFKSKNVMNKNIFVPVDSVISRFIEIFLSLPRLILILTVAAISRPSVTSIILIIGLTSWSEIARLMRAQILQLRELNYISAAKAIGAGSYSVIMKHLFPNSISQIKVLAIFGIASAVLTETGLSFLGVGVPADTATWGSLMFEARENYQAWWLVVFTGLAIFSLLSILFNLGNKLSDSSQKTRSLS